MNLQSMILKSEYENRSSDPTSQLFSMRRHHQTVTTNNSGFKPVHIGEYEQSPLSRQNSSFFERKMPSNPSQMRKTHKLPLSVYENSSRQSMKYGRLSIISSETSLMNRTQNFWKSKFDQLLFEKKNWRQLQKELNAKIQEMEEIKQTIKET